jgi:hypothetical protein
MKRTPTKEEAKASLTIREFLAQFSTDEACLNHLFDIRFGQGHKCPKCSRKAEMVSVQGGTRLCLRKLRTPFASHSRHSV